MSDEELEYSIDKKSSLLKTILVTFLILGVIFIIYGIPLIQVFKNKTYTSEGLISGGVTWGLIFLSCFVIVYIFAKPWKFPFRTKWNKMGLVLGYPNGKIKEIFWKDVTKIGLEAENRLKLLVPIYSVGKFSWNSAFWFIYSGRWNGTTKDFKFIHLTLKNNKIIVIPVPTENFDEAVNFLGSIPALDSKPKSFSLKFRWIFLFVIATFLITFIIFLIFSSAINKSSLIFPLSLFAILFISLFGLIIRSMIKQRVLIGGWIAEGSGAYVAGGFYLILLLVISYLVIKGIIGLTS